MNRWTICSPGTPQVYGYRIVFRNGGTSAGMAEIPAIPPRATREPVTEVHQIGNEIKVIIELPGAKDDMIQLEITGSTLVIDARDADHHYHTTASLPLVDAGSMQRSFKNGILEVTFGNLPAGTTVPGTN